MQNNILSESQIKLLSLVKEFNKDFGLVGGTAIALYLGHRESIDFDLFSNKNFSNIRIQGKILKNHKINTVIVNEEDEFTCVCNNVKLTFLKFPFILEFKENFNNIINLPDLLTLSAMKAYALSRRSKWKDYVDLYFILKNKYSLKQIIKKSEEIFGDSFNEKIFRVQLCYFKDIDYTEKVIYKKGFEVKDSEIKKELQRISLE